MANELQIADLITAAKNELREAIQRFAEDKRQGELATLPLSVQEIIIEAQVTATCSAETGGEVKFYVVGASTKGNMSDQSVQKVTIRLIPENDDGEPLLLGGSKNVKK